MARSSSLAPQIGAALAAGLMLAAAAAFGGGGGDSAPQTPSDAPAGAQPGLSAPWTADIASAPSAGAAPAAGTVQEAAPVIAAAPMLAVIIDDVGLDAHAARVLMALDAPVTLAILPYAPRAPELAREAAASGREVFLHLPMEPAGLEDPGPFALTKMMDAHASRARVEWAFARVPGASGFNNHMGSRLTADRARMDALFEALQARRDMIFVDSLTSPRSQAGAAARAHGFTALRRDVFLDNERSEEAVRARLAEAFALARERGGAIAIGHPYRETLAVLGELSALAEAEGVRLVTVRELAGAGE